MNVVRERRCLRLSGNPGSKSMSLSPELSSPHDEFPIKNEWKNWNLIESPGYVQSMF